MARYRRASSWRATTVAATVLMLAFGVAGGFGIGALAHDNRRIVPETTTTTLPALPTPPTASPPTPAPAPAKPAVPPAQTPGKPLRPTKTPGRPVIPQAAPPGVSKAVPRATDRTRSGAPPK
ncbi:MAG: hypothetical protein NVSMB25_04670 [Thermoleophilaceae bacterium]